MTNDDVARFRERSSRTARCRPRLSCYRALLLTDPRVVRFRVSAPTTMVWSSKDVALGRWGAEHSAEWVDGPFELVVLDDVSHWIPTQAPDVLADAILDRVAG